MQWLPWYDASFLAAASATATKGLASDSVPKTLRRISAVAAWTRELAVMLSLYALWQMAGDLSLSQAGGAETRGAELYRWERVFRLPSERSVQHVVLGIRWLVRGMNLYYVGLHVVITGCCLVWLFACHRSRYPAVRNTLALATGASLLVALVPVAPPRLVPGLGVVDTGQVVGPTVYPATARPGLDQLSAMPSVHVAWAVIVAGAVIYALRSPWRWLAVAYPTGTILVVVMTGNHYWADGLVAILLCCLSWLAVRCWQARAGHGVDASPVQDEPAVARRPTGPPVRVSSQSRTAHVDLGFVENVPPREPDRLSVDDVDSDR